jgi:hypothetical protein
MTASKDTVLGEMANASINGSIDSRSFSSSKRNRKTCMYDLVHRSLSFRLDDAHSTSRDKAASGGASLCFLLEYRGLSEEDAFHERGLEGAMEEIPKGGVSNH